MAEIKFKRSLRTFGDRSLAVILTVWLAIVLIWTSVFPILTPDREFYVKVSWLLITVAALAIVRRLPTLFPGWALAATSILVDALCEVSSSEIGDTIVTLLRIPALLLLLWGFREVSRAFDEGENFRKFVEVLPVGVAIYRNGRIVYSNDAARRLQLSRILERVAESAVRGGRGEVELKAGGRVLAVKAVTLELAARRSAILSVVDETQGKMMVAEYRILHEVESAPDIRSAAARFLELLAEVVDFEKGEVFLKTREGLTPLVGNMEAPEDRSVVFSHEMGDIGVVVALSLHDREMSDFINRIVKNFGSVLKDRLLSQQLRRNLGAFALLVDRIMNPLAVIAGLAEMECREDVAEKIIEQVEKIAKLVEEIEEKWRESESLISWDFLTNRNPHLHEVAGLSNEGQGQGDLCNRNNEAAVR